MMIGVLDYGAGNLGSVMNAFARLGCNARFVADPDELNGSTFERIVFPGDGHFATAARSLIERGYADPIRAWIRADRPFLGICIGLQLLLETSEEAPPENGVETRGLSVITGKVRRFPGRKVPQIGWNQTRVCERANHSRVFRGLPPDSFFYYIHSYYAAPTDDSWVAAEAEYYLPYCAAVERGAMCAVQFHPEKSGAVGLQLLENWAK